MKPKRIVLIRHGESQGNINKKLYGQLPDYAIYLTDKGKEQAKEAGNKLKEIIGQETYCAYFSPYFRARQTMDVALNQLNPLKLEFFREEVRMREQEHSGKLHNGRHDYDTERESFGKFFYRMDGGESGADVYDRVSDLIGTLNRDFEKANFPNNLLLFGHGMSNRMFIMRWLQATVEQFETWKNPRNGDLYILELQDNNKYKLITEIPLHPKGYGYKYNP
jgi:broad specificity phosphatase PhoE